MQEKKAKQEKRKTEEKYIAYYSFFVYNHSIGKQKILFYASQFLREQRKTSHAKRMSK